MSSSKKKKQSNVAIRQTIRLVCNVLYRFGVHDDVSASIVTTQHTHMPVSPEVLRKAKFDSREAGVCMLLWRMVHHVCALGMRARLCEQNNKESQNSAANQAVPVARHVIDLGDHGVVYSRWRESFHLFKSKDSASQGARFVFSVLEALGASEALRSFLHSTEYVGSRALLVVLGWLMAKLDVFQGYLDLLEYDIRMAPFLPPYNRNVPTCASSADPMSAVVRLNAIDTGSLRAEKQRVQEEAKDPEVYHTVLQLHGRVRYALRGIAQDQARIAALAHELDEALAKHGSSGSNKADRLSPFHVWLMQDADRSRLLELFIGDWVRMTKGGEDIAAHEKTWMAWLSSAVVLHHEACEKKEADAARGDDGEETKTVAHFLFRMQPFQGLTDDDSSACLRHTVSERNKLHRRGGTPAQCGSYEFLVSDTPARSLRLENMFQDTPGYFSSSVRTCTVEASNPIAQLHQLSENLLREREKEDEAVLSHLKSASSQ